METDPLDRFTVPDFPYNPEEFRDMFHVNHNGIVVIKDRFEGYRALDPEDWNNWQKAIEDASS